LSNPSLLIREGVLSAKENSGTNKVRGVVMCWLILK